MLQLLARKLDTSQEVIVLSFARLADALGNGLVIIVLPLYIEQQPSEVIHVPPQLLVGLAIGLYGLLLAIGQPVAGRLSDRLGRRRPFILAGLALMTVATLGFIPANRFLWILGLRGLQGLGVAIILPAVLALISGSTQKRNRGNAMGVYTTFRMAGFAAGPLLAGVIQVHYGFNAAFVTGSAFLALAFALVFLYVHEIPVQEGAARIGAAESTRAAEGPSTTGASPADDAPGFLPSPSMLALMLSSVVLASSLSMIAALETDFNARLEQTALGFGIAFSALTISRLIVQIPMGRLSDRIGRKVIIIVSLVVLAPITLLFGYVGTTLQLVGLRVAQGIATAGIAAPAFALAGDLAREGGEGQQMSYVTMGFGLGLAAGPLLAGALAGYTGNFALPFWIVGAGCVLAAAVVWRWAEESITPAAVFVEDA